MHTNTTRKSDSDNNGANNIVRRHLDFALTQLEAMKAVNIKTLLVSQHTNLMDYMLICDANSKRHAQAIADRLREEVKRHRFELIGIEGADAAEWILVDLNYVVVHIMLPEVRSFYRLEDLWSGNSE